MISHWSRREEAGERIFLYHFFYWDSITSVPFNFPEIILPHCPFACAIHLQWCYAWCGGLDGCHCLSHHTLVKGCCGQWLLSFISDSKPQCPFITHSKGGTPDTKFEWVSEVLCEVQTMVLEGTIRWRTLSRHLIKHCASAYQTPCPLFIDLHLLLQSMEVQLHSEWRDVLANTDPNAIAYIYMYGPRRHNKIA